MAKYTILEEQAFELLQKKWSHLYTFGFPKKPYPLFFENDFNSVMLGLKLNHSEKDKLEFALEKIKNIGLHFALSKNDAVQRCQLMIMELENELLNLEKNGNNAQSAR